jgi:hypothetical protein
MNNFNTENAENAEFHRDLKCSAGCVRDSAGWASTSLAAYAANHREKSTRSLRALR